MYIIVGNVRSTPKNSLGKRSADHTGRNTPARDRRKRKQDRRKSIRDGVIVRLSFKHDRRSGRDRRKA